MHRIDKICRLLEEFELTRAERTKQRAAKASSVVRPPAVGRPPSGKTQGRRTLVQTDGDGPQTTRRTEQNSTDQTTTMAGEAGSEDELEFDIKKILRGYLDSMMEAQQR